MDCSLPGSSVLRILQARILKWDVIPSFRGSSWPRDRMRICRSIAKSWTWLSDWTELNWVPPGKPRSSHNSSLSFCYNFFVQSLSHVQFVTICPCSVTQSCPTLCDPMDARHTRLPCPSSPRACSISCPLSQCCHPTISSSVIPFSSCLLSFPASESFLVSQFFTLGGQSTRASASVSVLPMNI